MPAAPSCGCGCGAAAGVATPSQPSTGVSSGVSSAPHSSAAEALTLSRPGRARLVPRAGVALCSAGGSLFCGAVTAAQLPCACALASTTARLLSAKARFVSSESDRSATSSFDMGTEYTLFWSGSKVASFCDRVRRLRLLTESKFSLTVASSLSNVCFLSSSVRCSRLRWRCARI
eukprot:scaffold12038_cov61-Phaeocystis_antarctica.AAC.3